jgi:hypothetical protein
MMSSHFILAYCFVRLHLAHSKSPKTNFESYSVVHEATDTNEMTIMKHSDLIKLFEALVRKEKLYYFDLCEQIGVEIVDAMVRGRLVELRWTPTITSKHRSSNSEVSPTNQSDSQKPVIVSMTPIMQRAIVLVLSEVMH